MNRGVLQSSPVQQIMAAGNPNWWAIAAARPPSHHHHHHHHSHSPFTPPPLPSHHHNNTNFNVVPNHTSSSPLPFSSSSSNWPLNCGANDNAVANQDYQITPDSWSQQLFMSGLVGEEDRANMNHQGMHMEQLVKQENYNSSTPREFVHNEQVQQAAKPNNNDINSNSLWSSHHHNSKFMASTNSTAAAASVTTTATSSPQSCVTTNLLEFSSATAKPNHQLIKSECNSSPVINGGAVKKARVHTSATQSTFKVRKFGDRITALHQLVSPFGKTDTASVLLEAIGYIRFLQSQIEALSLPYLSSGSGYNKRQQHPHSAQGERNCIFPEDPGQLLNDNCLKRKGGPDQEELKKDLRSRGLCLVPVSCTLNVGRDNGADYWAPTLGGFQ